MSAKLKSPIIREILDQRVRNAALVVRHGRIVQTHSTTVRARVPDLCMGQQCVIHRRSLGPLPAEVVGLDDEQGALLMPLGPLLGIALDDQVTPAEEIAMVPTGDGLMGRVVNSL